MPSIQYLKNAPLGKTGDIAEVQEHEAKVLITLGFATDVSNVLRNQSGGLVVDDFGELVQQVTPPPPAPAKKKDTSKSK